MIVIIRALVAAAAAMSVWLGISSSRFGAIIKAGLKKSSWHEHEFGSDKCSGLTVTVVIGVNKNNTMRVSCPLDGYISASSFSYCAFFFTFCFDTYPPNAWLPLSPRQGL